MRPVSFSDTELDQVIKAAESLPIVLRGPFMLACGRALSSPGTDSPATLVEGMRRTFMAMDCHCPEGDDNARFSGVN